jgi:hypothetical protein
MRNSRPPESLAVDASVPLRAWLAGWEKDYGFAAVAEAVPGADHATEWLNVIVMAAGTSGGVRFDSFLNQAFGCPCAQYGNAYVPSQRSSIRSSKMSFGIQPGSEL